MWFPIQPLSVVILSWKEVVKQKTQCVYKLYPYNIKLKLTRQHSRLISLDLFVENTLFPCSLSLTLTSYG